MHRMLATVAILTAGQVAADDKAFTLLAPPALVESGFMKHLLPRFSLKTSVRITLVEQGGEAVFGDTGVAVFRDDEQLWHLEGSDDPDIAAFEKWLLSDVGKRTIDAFAPDDEALFSSDVTQVAIVKQVELTGDAALGEKTSLVQCGRCHVVNEKNRMNAIGSTPSFALMRTFPDWQERFETFFMLKPHPAFTQVAEITEPFPENLPSPIAPIEVTWEEIEAITAYVGSIAPADLGAPIQSQ